MPAPQKPATTPSLPGAMSQRTDGGIASKQAQRYISGMPSYGDGQELANLQAQAPMAATPSPKPASKTAIKEAAQGQAQQGPTALQAANMPNVVPLTAPTQFPNEPVTTGAATGLGAGPDVLGLQAPDLTSYQTAREGLQNLAANPQASPALRALASKIQQRY